VSSVLHDKKVAIIARFSQVACQNLKPAPTCGENSFLQHAAFRPPRFFKVGKLKQLGIKTRPENVCKFSTTGVSGSIHQGAVVDTKMMSCCSVISSGSHYVLSCI